MSRVAAPALAKPVSRCPKPEQERDVRVVQTALGPSRPLVRRQVGDFEHRINSEAECPERIDVIGHRPVVRPRRSCAGDGIERDCHRGQVAIDSTVRELAALVVAPARVPWLAEGGMGHHDHDPGVRPQDPVKRGRHELEVGNVGDAQQEDRGIEADGPKGRDEVESAGIADHEASRPRPALPGSLDERRACVDAGVAGTSLEDERGENTLAGTDIKKILPGSWVKELQSSRDRQALVVEAPALADPAVVPERDVIPARISSRRSPSGTTLVP